MSSIKSAEDAELGNLILKIAVVFLTLVVLAGIFLVVASGLFGP